jgi:hypothetical protein
MFPVIAIWQEEAIDTISIADNRYCDGIPLHMTPHYCHKHLDHIDGVLLKEILSINNNQYRNNINIEYFISVLWFKLQMSLVTEKPCISLQNMYIWQL